jgi:Na+/glutamate symporter
MLLVLIAGAAVGLATWLVVGTPFAKRPVTKAQIEHAVAKRTAGNVQLTLCNQEAVPSQSPKPDAPDTWTCDTYIGPTAADAQNGPSYKVTVGDDRIRSIRRVPTH